MTVSGTYGTQDSHVFTRSLIPFIICTMACPLLGGADAARAAAPSLPPLTAILAALGKQDWATGVHQIPATVIDVGINRTADGKIVGDVEFSEVEPLAAHITPVPGGVGLLTIAMLMSNTVKAARLRRGRAAGVPQSAGAVRS